MLGIYAWPLREVLMINGTLTSSAEKSTGMTQRISPASGGGAVASSLAGPVELSLVAKSVSACGREGDLFFRCQLQIPVCVNFSCPCCHFVTFFFLTILRCDGFLWGRIVGRSNLARL